MGVASAAVRMASPDELPVIDISPLYETEMDAGSQLRINSVAAAVRAACITTGFFYVSGGRVTSASVLMNAAREFFDQPEHFKNAVASSRSKLRRGYTPLGGAHNCTSKSTTPDAKESFLLGAEGTASRMHGDSQWPDLPGWRDTMQGYFSEAVELSRVVASALALSLDLPRDFFQNHLTDPVAQMLLLRYPPPAQGNIAVNAGCGAHTDCGFLTILAQVRSAGVGASCTSSVLCLHAVRLLCQHRSTVPHKSAGSAEDRS